MDGHHLRVVTLPQNIRGDAGSVSVLAVCNPNGHKYYHIFTYSHLIADQLRTQSEQNVTYMIVMTDGLFKY